MSIRAEEITEILKSQIKGYEKKIDVTETGVVLSVGDGIARVYGLEKAMAGELLEFPGERPRHGPQPRGGQRRRRAPRRRPADQGRRHGPAARAASSRCRCGDAMIGRVVNALGQPIDGKGPIETKDFRRVEIKAPGIVERQPVKEPLQTGIKAIDAMIPIGRGQRELIIGDRQTGKTAIAIDTIINQKGDRRRLHLRRHRAEAVHGGAGGREARGSTARWTTRSSSPRRRPNRPRCSSSPPTPAARWASTSATTAGTPCASTTTCPSTPWPTASSRCCCAGRRAARRTPATSSTSTRGLLERAAKLTEAEGGGSLTALPIIETQAGDVSAYIPTNVISITDGQIYLEADLFYSGVRPGGQRRPLGLPRRRQRPDQGDEAGRRHAAPRPGAVPRAGGLRAVRLRPRQGHPDAARPRRSAWSRSSSRASTSPCRSRSRSSIIFAATNGFADGYEVGSLARYEIELTSFMKDKHGELLSEIREKKAISDDLKARLSAALEEFKGIFKE